MDNTSIIQIKDAKIFQREQLVLSDVTFNIDKGEFIYLVGKTGAGKSSLLKTLYGDLKLLEGNGTVANFELRNLKRNKIPYLRRKIGIVFQDFQLLSDRTVNENLIFVMRATGWKDKKKMQKRIDEVLKSVGLETKGFRMPHRLSGGEQQRVAVARALVNDPDIILADEPTGNLDPETSREIMKLLFDISKNGRAIIMATHDILQMEEFKARTLRCENERVIDEAKPEIKQFSILEPIKEPAPPPHSPIDMPPEIEEKD